MKTGLKVISTSPRKNHLSYQFCNLNFLEEISKKSHIGQVTDRITTPNAQSTSPGLSGTTFFACQILNKIQMPPLKIEHLLHAFSRYGNSQGLHKAYASYAVITGHNAHINSKRENKLCKAAVRRS